MRRAGSARLEIVNVAGQRVVLLADGPREAGSHVAHWNGTDAHGRRVGAGVYFARLTQPEGVTVQRLLLLR
jgi:flagellar hook assembly protein FlgD